MISRSDRIRAEMARLLRAGKEEREFTSALARRFPDVTEAEFSVAFQDALEQVRKRLVANDNRKGA